MNWFNQAIRPLLQVAVIGVGISGCVSVDIVKLSNQTYPPKASPQEVEVLDRKPPCTHVAIAQLSVDDSEYDDFESEQRKILKKAAEIGADGVIFSKPEKHKQHGVMYSGMGCYMCGPWGMGMYGYPGWGYGMGYGYGMYGYGMGGMAVPYDYTVKSLKGIAIHYTDPSGPKC